MGRLWSAEDVERLAVIYPNTDLLREELAVDLNRSVPAIHLKANRLGLKRPLEKIMRNPNIRAKLANRPKTFGVMNPFYGKKHKPETILAMKQKLSRMMAGPKNPFYGKHHTEENRKRMNISKRTLFRGDKNPAWHGGYEPYYGPNWQEQKRLVLERDQHRCYLCGKTKIENGKQLDVHHIKPFRYFGRKQYAEANALINLISLCVSCHRKKIGGKNI